MNNGNIGHNSKLKSRILLATKNLKEMKAKPCGQVVNFTF